MGLVVKKIPRYCCCPKGYAPFWYSHETGETYCTFFLLNILFYVGVELYWLVFRVPSMTSAKHYNDIYGRDNDQTR